jgi:predicted Fe-S protein YdhL (DUF1289 family)
MSDSYLDQLAREDAIKTLAARAESARAMAENIPSPCVSVCSMDEDSGLCEGCWRTVDEICDWAVNDDAEKQAVWAAIAQRLRQAHPSLLA